MKKANVFKYGAKTNMATYRDDIKYIKGVQGCENCGLKTWNGKPITLQVHHIDGDKKNNTLENLQLLCPNCHSQTPNWSKRKGDR